MAIFLNILCPALITTEMKWTVCGRTENSIWGPVRASFTTRRLFRNLSCNFERCMTHSNGIHKLKQIKTAQKLPFLSICIIMSVLIYMSRLSYLERDRYLTWYYFGYWQIKCLWRSCSFATKYVVCPHQRHSSYQLPSIIIMWTNYAWPRLLYAYLLRHQNRYEIGHVLFLFPPKWEFLLVIHHFLLLFFSAVRNSNRRRRHDMFVQRSMIYIKYVPRTFPTLKDCNNRSSKGSDKSGCIWSATTGRKFGWNNNLL